MASKMFLSSSTSSPSVANSMFLPNLRDSSRTTLEKRENTVPMGCIRVRIIVSWSSVVTESRLWVMLRSVASA